MSWSTITNPVLGKRTKKRVAQLQDNFNQPTSSMDSSNMLSSIYRGKFDRFERYRTYDAMDRDSDISRALDLIAEHASEENVDNSYFDINWFHEPTEEESVLVKENLTQWSRVNEWDNRLFRTMRNVIKYGDWFFFRNPDTFELYTIHPKFVVGAMVNRERLEIVGRIIRNFKINVDGLEMGTDNKSMQNGITTNVANNLMLNTKVIPAKHIIHLTLSEGKFAGAVSDDDMTDRMNDRWPFGESWLEQGYKTFKQRELLEDAALIHRVQRAPSRTVWYIDTGKARADKASWVVNNFKNELNQKRVPQFIGQNGAGEDSVDSVYNPISQLEDIYIPVSYENRGSKVETLEGTPWDNLPDLDYFTKKTMRSLRVPYAWLLGSQEGGAVFNDGRAGVAYHEEIEFARFVTRIQRNVIRQFDFEFKVYCNVRDVLINFSDFDMTFVPPTNWESYRQNAVDQDNISTWSSIDGAPWDSKRFAAKRYLGWSEDEITENERMWLEENPQDDGVPDAGDDMGGGMGGGLGGMDMGGGMAPLTDPDMAGGDFGGAMGDMGGGAAGMGGGDMGGGMGESNMNLKQLLETDITFDDIEPAPEKGVPYDKEVPKDRLMMRQNTISPNPITKLSTIRKLRKAHMARRVERDKRMKTVKIVYTGGGSDDDGMGMGGGLF